ncbi:hypothetical protein Leryth_013138 [Lithospermum erythrorhizon]|nr:hypothetical protein Leryth_013138 [Lithospermum erythrorhizon]
MDGGENILDAILYEENADEFGDAEMFDVEEGELVEEDLNAGEGEKSVPAVTKENQEPGNGNQNNKKKKKKNRKKKNKIRSGGPEGFDIDLFVIDVCRRLRERKSYLVYAAVGCLGVSALNDLVNEVDAIQACGGQKISGGMRPRTGGGILWNILKTRDSNAYKEIMKKGREFEKQFMHQSIKREPALPSVEQSSHLESDMLKESEMSKAGENHSDVPVKVTCGEKHTSVHDRLRVPVSYSDLLEEENLDDKRVIEGENLLDERPLSSPSVI